MLEPIQLTRRIAPQPTARKWLWKRALTPLFLTPLFYIQTFFVKKGKIVGKCGGVLRKDDASEFYNYVAEKGLE